MSRNKKYYWMKLPEDFFDDDAIQWLKEQPNGEKYALFYIELCTKSIRNKGVLIRRVGDMLIPYDAAKLAMLTNTDIEVVVVAMELLKQAKLVEILENGEIYLNAMENMVGTESESAKRMRRLREKQALLPSASQCDAYVTKECAQCSPEIDKEIEIDKEKEIDIYTSDSAEFFLFWREYPNKKNKQTAINRWDKMRVTPELYAKIMEGLQRAKNSREWAEQDGKYIPHPASWLNAGGWENEYRPLQPAEPEKQKPQTGGNDALDRRRQMMGG